MLLHNAAAFKKESAPGPPEPSQLYTLKDDGTISGLRQNKEVYTSFLKNFGKTVFGRTFSANSQTKHLSNFFPTALEAFLILAYENGYEMWKKAAADELRTKYGSGIMDHDEDKDSVECDEETPKHVVSFKFTSDARGSKRAEGWSEQGLDLFNKLFDAIAGQRKLEETGIHFETEFMVFGNSEEDRAKGEQFRSPLRNDWGNREQYEPVAVTGPVLFEV